MISFFKKKQEPAPPEPRAPGFFSTEFDPSRITRDKLLQLAESRTFQRVHSDLKAVDAAGVEVAMGMDDGSNGGFEVKYGLRDTAISDAQISWYGSQSFIGYQLCAMIAQNWLVGKACAMPARDAARHGFEVSIADGTEVKPEVLAHLKKMDKRMHLRKNMEEFIRLGRVFGVRYAVFVVESPDPGYYEKPFNPDGVTDGSYKGIAQIDPYWVSPELASDGIMNPGAINFYNPTWYRINGMGRVHRSHMVIFKTEEQPDLLKPTYSYGGMSVPQKIFERVYAAERTANEAPLLAMTKRTTAIHVDMEKATADPANFEENMLKWVYYRDNHGIKVLGQEETMEQHDTALNDLDMVIMTQYQIVAAAAEVPATKLFGTQPKGFNASGEYEEASYHEMLESIQSHDLTPLVERHHLLCIRSEIVSKFNVKPFETEVAWVPLDSPTSAELATTNYTKAQTAQILQGLGAIDGAEERERLINDPDSGYSGLSMELIPEVPDETEEEEEANPAEIENLLNVARGNA